MHSQAFNVFNGVENVELNILNAISHFSCLKSPASLNPLHELQNFS